MSTSPEAKPAIILVNPQLGENIGTAARAMGNFGLNELRIVKPRDGWPSERARKAASGADGIIDAASIFESVEDAIADLHQVYATTARPRDMIKTVFTPEQAASEIRRRATAGQKSGILFGRERWGLENDEIALSDAVVMAPVDPRFASLNIAQAVLLIGYEWYKPDAQTLGMATEELPATGETGLAMPHTRPATKTELLRFFEHLESELDQSGFFKSPDMRPTMVRSLRNMLQRAQMTEQEVRTWRGVVASLVRAHMRSKAGRRNPQVEET